LQQGLLRDYIEYIKDYEDKAVSSENLYEAEDNKFKNAF
jgi:hypothetical protein